jgi:hypothetical protein
MIYCKTVDGVVVDRSVFDAPMPEDWPDFEMWQESEVAQIGWTYAEGEFVPPPFTPPEPDPTPRPHRVYQQTIWSRTTGAEAVALKAALDQAEIKFQMLFNSSDFFVSDHPMFALLHWTIAETLETEAGPNVGRADQLLEPATAEETAVLQLGEA